MRHKPTKTPYRGPSLIDLPFRLKELRFKRAVRSFMKLYKPMSENIAVYIFMKALKHGADDNEAERRILAEYLF